MRSNKAGFKKILIRFLRDEEGQSMVEYVMMLLLVVMVVVKFKSLFSGSMTKMLNTLDGKMQAAGEEIQ